MSTDSSSPASAALRLAPTRFARQCLTPRCGAPAQPDAPGRDASSSPASAALRLAPTRFARQCLTPRCGAPAQPDAPGPGPAPLRRRLRCASAGSYSLRSAMPHASRHAAVRRPQPDAPGPDRDLVAGLRCASAGSYSLRSAMPQATLRCAGPAGRNGRDPTSSSPSSAALRLAPTRFARQCLMRHAAVRRPSRTHRARDRTSSRLRCASAGSYSLRSAMPCHAGAPAQPDAPRSRPPLRFGWLLLASLGNSPRCASLAPTRFARALRAPDARRSSAALRLAPTRFARQCLTARCGAPASRRTAAPLRFGRLLLASLGSASASLRCAGTHPGASAALRLAPTRFARQCLTPRCGAPAQPDAGP